MDARAHDRIRLVTAYLFGRSGGKPISESQLWRDLAFDLKWLAPKPARAFAEALPRTGLVSRDDDGALTPTFDHRSVQIPLDIRLDESLVDQMPDKGTMMPVPDARPTTPSPAPSPPVAQRREAPAKDPLPRAEETLTEPPRPQSPYGVLLHGLAELTGEPVPTWVERMNQTAQATSGALDPPAALLLAAARHGVDVAPFIEAVRRGYER